MLKQLLNSRSKAEKLVVFGVIFLACLTLTHAVYYAYSVYFDEIHANRSGTSLDDYYRLYTTIPLSPEHPFFSGTDHAPDQYRIGIAYPVGYVATKLHIKKFYILFSVVDFAAAGITCSILYLTLCGSVFFHGLRASSQTTTVVLFLVSLAYPFAWVVPWQRPETLATALYLALVLLFLGRVRTSRLWLIAIILISIGQTFVRADVPAIFGLAVCLFGLTPRVHQLFGSRKTGVFCGIAIAVCALAGQAYLKCYLFPNATYPPNVPVVQFFFNFRIRTLTTFAIAILPFAFTLFLAVKYRKFLDAEDILMVFASCVYLPLWWTIGIIGEVRIFVPFIFALTPVTAKLLLLALRGQRFSTAEEATEYCFAQQGS